MQKAGEGRKNAKHSCGLGRKQNFAYDFELEDSTFLEAQNLRIPQDLAWGLGSKSWLTYVTVGKSFEISVVSSL